MQRTKALGLDYPGRAPKALQKKLHIHMRSFRWAIIGNLGMPAFLISK